VHTSQVFIAHQFAGIALLGWSQSYLAEGVSVRRAIIADLESGKLIRRRQHYPH
jgi:ribosome-binding protein aMBF1 (putative translation factor)